MGFSFRSLSSRRSRVIFHDSLGQMLRVGGEARCRIIFHVRKSMSAGCRRLGNNEASDNRLQIRLS